MDQFQKYIHISSTWQAAQLKQQVLLPTQLPLFTSTDADFKTHTHMHVHTHACVHTCTHTHTHLHRVEEIHQLVLLFQDVQETGADMVVTTTDVGVQTSLEQQVDGAHVCILHAAKAPASVPMCHLYLCICEVEQQRTNVSSLSV